MFPVLQNFGRAAGLLPANVSAAFGIGALRQASKKASGGGNKNPKQPKGKNKGVHYGEGCRVFFGDIIVHRQGKLGFHPGLNVRLAGKLNIVARKEGTVRFTCEVPDLDWASRKVQKHYGDRDPNVPMYKKYVHVIPDPQHDRFRLVDSV